MRLIMRKHTISNTVYGASPTKQEYDKLLGEKGELTMLPNGGQIGDKGLAGLKHEFKAFDPCLNSIHILVHSIKTKGNVVTIKSAHGNTFVFDKIA